MNHKTTIQSDLEMCLSFATVCGTTECENTFICLQLLGFCNCIFV